MKSINSKFLLGIGGLAILFSGVVLYRTWTSTRDHIEDLTIRQAHLATAFDLAIRKYVGEVIRPEMQRRVETYEFIPETMSTSFVARSIFEKVRKDFPDYLLKFSSDNPRNPINWAGPEELEVLRYFNENPHATKWVGKANIGGKEYMAYFTPRRMKKSCLRCHGRPEDAPKSLILRYGSKAGFHRSVGSVIAMDTIAVPMDEINAALVSQASEQLAVMAVWIVILFGSVFLMFRWIVGRRLGVITRYFEQALEQDEGTALARITVRGRDEIAVLASAFNSLMTRLHANRLSLQRQVRERDVEIKNRQKAAAELAKAKEAAEAADLAKSRFLANMSHEIRTPLTGILGFTELLRRGADQGDEAEREDYLKTIHASGTHLLGLVHDILDLSKIEAGQMEFECVSCRPYQIIAEVASVLRPKAQEKGLTLECRWNGGVPETIYTDPARLQQLLTNLAGNAIKFTETGGVQIVAELVHHNNKPQLKISVTDTGIGIPMDKVKYIFDPFVQADSSVTREYGGTGLGLAISRRITSGLGGQLTVHSEVGKGSTFTATIDTGSLEDVAILPAPPADGVAGSSRKLEESVLTLPPARVLLVEDGDTNRKLISLMLRRAGAEVTTAENGQLAVDLVANNPFDLILMDMQMPVMDGYTATTELRLRGATMPIIALTAHAMKGDMEKCKAAGCCGYLSKPVDSDELLRTVADALATSDTGTSEPSHSPAEPSAPGSPLVSSLPDADAEFREIVEEFVGRLTDQLDAMHRAWAERDLEELARLAHWLKGSGGTVGFDAFTEPAKRLEQAAKQNQSDMIEAALAEIVRLAGRIAKPSTGSTTSMA